MDIEDIFSAPSHLAEGSDFIADIVVLRDGMSIGQRGRGLAACGSRLALMAGETPPARQMAVVSALKIQAQDLFLHCQLGQLSDL